MWASYVTTEDDIKNSGITYTLLRCGWYAEKIPLFLGEKVLRSGIYFPAGDREASFVKRAKMGDAIAKILTGSGHENKSYLITGDNIYSFQQIATMRSESMLQVQFFYTSLD